MVTAARRATRKACVRTKTAAEILAPGKLVEPQRSASPISPEMSALMPLRHSARRARASDTSTVVARTEARTSRTSWSANPLAEHPLHARQIGDLGPCHKKATNRMPLR